MKKLFFLILPVFAMCVFSCNKEGGQPDPNRDFNKNAVPLCQSYLGMTTSAAATKMQQDWDYTAAYGDEFALCSPGDETISATAENGVIYKVSYLRTFNGWSMTKVMNIADIVCPAVYNFYTNVNPSTYSDGQVGLGNDSQYFSSHDALLEYVKNNSDKVVSIKEQWGHLEPFQICQKTWYVTYDYPTGSLSSVSFILDLGKQ